MRKEIAIVITIGLFLLAYALDYAAGPVSIPGKSPYFILQSPALATYPLTVAAVFVRTLALFLSVTLIYSAIEKKYFTKAIISFFLGVVAEFYAIQQMATGTRTTKVQWTLAIAYTGTLMFVLVAYYILKGIIHLIKKSVSGEEKEESYPDPILQDEDEKEEEIEE